MSIGRNREEQELTRLLASTLVQKEMLEPMNKIGWGHSAPPPPDYTGQPAAADGAPAPAATTTPAAPQAAEPVPACATGEDKPGASATISRPQALSSSPLMGTRL